MMCILYMCAATWLANLELIPLHGPDGQLAYVNSHEIASLREPNAQDLARHFPRGTHCVLVFGSGRFLAVSEHCDAIRELLRAQLP